MERGLTPAGRVVDVRIHRRLKGSFQEQITMDVEDSRIFVQFRSERTIEEDVRECLNCIGGGRYKRAADGNTP